MKRSTRPGPPWIWRIIDRAISASESGPALEIASPRGWIVGGTANSDEAPVRIEIDDRWFPLRFMTDPALATAEAYMDGRLVLRRGSLREFLLTGARIARHKEQSGWDRLANRIRRAMLPANGIVRASRNARHHYDLPTGFYRQFLDARLQYSCAYFLSDKDTLETAQERKIAHIGGKLALSPGQRMLDIGCGWGTLAIALSETSEVAVTGVSLAHEQIAEARRLAVQSPMSGLLDFRILDYREVGGTFDRIVSVGMLEHVGRRNLDEFFTCVGRLLAADGVAVVHSIGRWDANTGPDSFTQRYIFPGGHIPSLSEVIPAVERSGLKLLDCEILRLHYAMTLERWSERFARNRASIAALHGERFCRMWEFYLAAAETGFREGQLMNFQLVLAHRRDAVPLTREYMTAGEDRIFARLAASRAPLLRTVPLDPVRNNTDISNLGGM